MEPRSLISMGGLRGQGRGGSIILGMVCSHIKKWIVDVRDLDTFFYGIVVRVDCWTRFIRHLPLPPGWGTRVVCRSDQLQSLLLKNLKKKM